MANVEKSFQNNYLNCRHQKQKTKKFSCFCCVKENDVFVHNCTIQVERRLRKTHLFSHSLFHCLKFPFSFSKMYANRPKPLFFVLLRFCFVRLHKEIVLPSPRMADLGKDLSKLLCECRELQGHKEIKV